MIYDGSAMLMLEKWKNCHERKQINKQMSLEKQSKKKFEKKKLQFKEVQKAKFKSF